ncbi:MAG: 30S ribosomal protein S6 [Alphaproteobacteria bacterium]|jgi:small subunit ribosomal protein S6|nr:30S ribosomal protein S6 [Alphaproteobacteria bacterium]MBP9877983.1 30S ribosomal protein S6 [Alphaproteobacteria bacterium]
MAFYECVYLARQDLSTGQVETLNKDFAKIVEDLQGKIEKTEYWGLKGLAYRINKNRKAHYTLFHIDAPSEAVKEMERQMGLHEDVLRFLTTRIEAIEAGPSIMMTSKSDKYDDEEDDFGARKQKKFSKPRKYDQPAEADA